MIVYYAHCHGHGHSNSAQQFCKIFKGNAIILTSSDFEFEKGIEVVKIKSEDMEYSKYLRTVYNLPGYAHYLPKGERDLLHRNFQILEACLTFHIMFAIIDVSVETAIQFRIAGMPYAYNKMFGQRDDMPHRLTYEAADFLFAYYPRALENEKEEALTNKTHYLGFISRFKFRYNKSSPKNGDLNILVLTGNGGTILSHDHVAGLARQLPNSSFTLIGNTPEQNGIENINFSKPSSDLETLILAHDIIISSCGLNLTSELLALKNKFIAVPEKRPYGEQYIICNQLKKNNLAVELDFEDLEGTIQKFNSLPLNENLESYFGNMKDFKKIEKLKPYL